ncbi:MAG: hypothetical protein ABL876_00070 [Chitinophagaceae bacterium]
MISTISMDLSADLTNISDVLQGLNDMKISYDRAEYGPEESGGLIRRNVFDMMPGLADYVIDFMDSVTSLTGLLGACNDLVGSLMAQYPLSEEAYAAAKAEHDAYPAEPEPAGPDAPGMGLVDDIKYSSDGSMFIAIEE